MSGKAGGLPRRPPLSTARAAFTASQRKQARRRLPDTSDIATASGVKTAPRSSLTTTTVPLSLKPRLMRTRLQAFNLDKHSFPRSPPQIPAELTAFALVRTLSSGATWKQPLPWPLSDEETAAPARLCQGGHAVGSTDPVSRSLLLRPWEPADVPASLAAYQDDEIRRWHTRRPLTEACVRGWFDTYAVWEREQGCHWVVALDDGEVLGRIACAASTSTTASSTGCSRRPAVPAWQPAP